jgi:glycerophosphoryl diester phosphodiesterase
LLWQNKKSKELGRTIEFTRNKAPSFHEAQNLHITDKLLEELTAGIGIIKKRLFMYSLLRLQICNTSGLNHRKTIQLLSCYDVH